MKNVIEILDRYYDSFINQKLDWGFFLDLYDYVKLVAKTPEIDKIRQEIIKDRDKDISILNGYENKVIKETKKAKEKIFELIKEHKISYDELSREIKHYEDWENDRTQGSLSKGEALSHSLQNIIRSLFNHGHKKIFKDFFTEDKGIPIKIKEYTFSATIKEYFKEKGKFKEKRDIEAWGAWDNLVLVYQTISIIEKEKIMNKLKKNNEFCKQYNFIGFVGEMKKIKEKSINPNIDPNFEPKHFVKNKYIDYASRVHKYLIKELSSEKQKGEEVKPSIKLPANTLWEDIKIRFKNQYDIEIYVKGKFLEKTSNDKMGLCKAEDKKPDRRWEFLQKLSTFSISKSVKPTVEDIAYSLKVKKDNCMKIKEKLSKKLQENFGIYEDAFYSYKDRGFYQTRFELKPEPELRGNGEVYRQASGYNDAEEYNKPEKREYLNP